MTGEELDKTHTKFNFLRPSPDESTVGVVSSSPAGTMGDGAELDKTRPKFTIFKKVFVGEGAERCVFGLKRLIPPLYCW